MSTDKFKLGLLDFGYRSGDINAMSTLTDVLEYAKLADKLGYHSIWYGEHYNGSIAYNNPEILLPIVTGLTSQIRVGCGGVLIAAHSPYRVAMTYKVLCNIFPGRIDLGIGLTVPDFKFMELLLDKKDIERNIKDFAKSKSKELIDFYLNENENYLKGIVIPPYGGFKPNIWKLKTTFDELADCLLDRTNFCCSLFHKSDHSKSIDPQKLKAFNKAYFEKYGLTPKVSIAFSGICDVSIAKAQRTLDSLSMQHAERSYFHNCIVGTPDYFHERLTKLHEQTGIDYFIFYDLTKNIPDRHKSIKMLAKKFELSKPL